MGVSAILSIGIALRPVLHSFRVERLHPGVIDAAREYLVIVALTYGGIGVQLMVASCLFAAGRALTQLVLALSHLVVLLVPLAFLFDRLWGPSGIYAAVALATVLAASVAAWWARRTFRILRDTPHQAFTT